MAPIVPEILWAQRSNEQVADKNLIYLTIRAEDVAKPEIDLTETKLTYKGTSASGKEYSLELEFFENIDVENSTRHTTGIGSFLILRKKESKAEFWPRLIKDKRKFHYIRTDFDKWVDEDEQETAPADDFSQYGNGLDFSSLQSDFGSALGGLGGDAGGPSLGLPEEDSDDEDETEQVPELIKE
ncbi:putative Hsp90 binding co-chaperone Sba1 [Lipomyces japonicus]|uniref:putative Hsp90 binding co-chaperone Sba1 n=1 Tax=Lipomyces japonicus TaxID=56871 RepID=UPI0034CF9D2E